MGSKHESERLLLAARGLGGFRAAIGVVALLSPRLAGGVLLTEPDASGTRILLRMFAGREIALGVGQVLATKRGTAATHGWVEAGALSDAVDVVALVAGRRGLRTLPRWGGTLSALAATVVAIVLARGLSDG